MGQHKRQVDEVVKSWGGTTSTAKPPPFPNSSVFNFFFPLILFSKFLSMFVLVLWDSPQPPLFFFFSDFSHSISTDAYRSPLLLVLTKKA